MKFGKIDYLNLLPFHVYLKRSALSSYKKAAIEYKKGVPSRQNTALRRKSVDAAIISSVQSSRKNYKSLDFGIVAKHEVKSVLVRKNSPPQKDAASASSNALAAVLGLNGEVIIGDRALRAYINEGADKFIDLAKLWHERTNGLCFVFARFCYTSHKSACKRLVRGFLKTQKNASIKIPRYILQNYSKSRQISQKDILEYLKLISYHIGKKEKKALKLFLKQVKNLKK
ncbi:MqnA/MqnD/SBP family protein [Campylobacter sp. 19-13652]|uniref:MqnA/MqnD/SBP family protein n=1 Tax=Campylobacter sp. 19-13652 TaxID=2840180 RepID=UPI001C749327|nr:MqnA/MqnD/SBP family protein [Campylobacter sp. 19-13652]BCX78869.1 chorismate dehydratase [Campylobacter sp. 19-13652]